MSSKAKSVIPEGYTFFNRKAFVSSKAAELLSDLLEKAENRNPDAFNMYIYNKYYNFGILDLIDKTLSTIHTKIIKKNWDDAMDLLQALSVFQDIESSWPMCRDGEHIELTNKVYGASLVTVMRALKKEGCLDTTHFQSLETTLKYAAEWGQAISKLCGGSYHHVCQAIGMRLSKKKSKQTIALEKARLEEWIAGLDAEDQEYVRDSIKEAEEEAAELAEQGHVEQPWYTGAENYDEDEKDRDFVLSRVWKEYKEYLRSVPSLPLRGPPCWDISEWSAEERKPFEFGQHSDDDAMMF